MKKVAIDTLSTEEAEVKAVLEDVLGLSATKVQTSSTESADFFVEGDEPGYVIEVKSRSLPTSITSTPEEKTGPIVRSMRHDDAVGGWLAKAKRQMRALDSAHSRLWFLWAFAVSPISAEAQVDRIVSSLYGMRKAVGGQPPHRQFQVYYADRAAFERFPEIDGAIVYFGEGLNSHITFCPNEASPRLEAVLTSKIVRELRSLGVTQMLPVERVSDAACVVPRDLVGRGEPAVVEHLRAVLEVPSLVLWTKEVEYMDAIRLPSSPDRPLR